MFFSLLPGIVFCAGKRVIIKTGVMSRRTVELVLAKCEGIQVVQGAGCIFGYGSIVVTTGGVSNCYYYVVNSFWFKKEMVVDFY